MRVTSSLVASIGLVMVMSAASACTSAPSSENSSSPSGGSQPAAQLPAIVGSPDLALRRAALDGQAAVVEAALAKGADVNASSVDGVSPLMLAASRGHRSIVETLLQKGARLDTTTNSDKVTALMMAANWGHTPVVDLLLERGASINLRDSGKRNVLDWAGMDKTVSPENAKALQSHLKDKGAKPTPQDALGLFLSVGSMPNLGEIIQRATEDNPEVKAERVGGEVREPKKLTDVAPVYPEAARAAKLQGAVVLDVTVGPDGNVRNVKVLRGDPVLADAAVGAVKQWTYEPPSVGGRPAPVAFSVIVQVRPTK